MQSGKAFQYLHLARVCTVLYFLLWAYVEVMVTVMDKYVFVYCADVVAVV